MVEDIVRSFGLLTLGSRMKRIGERLQGDTQKIMDEMGVPLQVGQNTLLAALDRLGPLSIGEIAEALGVSQPGVTRTVSQLAAAGMVKSRQVKGDQRRRVTALTRRGQQRIDQDKRTFWPRVEAAVADLCADFGDPLLDQLAAIEDRLAAVPLDRRTGKSWRKP
jgi:DNA-binding MarR family transcriptional regulator